MSHCAKIVFLQNFGDVKNEVFEKKIVFLFFLFYIGEIETEKEENNENGKGQRPYINSFFLRWSSKNVKNKKMDFFFAKIA